MSDMSDLSPQAQAILNAYETAIGYRQGFAAALRAAVKQADPKRNIKDISYQHQLYVDGWKDALDKILTIAAELRGTTTTTETP